MGYHGTFYSREFEALEREYPALKPVFENEHWQLVGTLDVIDEFGKKWDQYQVKIIYPHEFPKKVPVMFETGGRIPRETDYHVNGDGSCCLSVPALEMIILSKGINTINFIQELAIPYLANQTYKRKKGHFAGEEFAHGAGGIYQFYSDTFQTQNPVIILTLLGGLILNQLTGRNNPCPCNSGKKYKKCHLQAVQYLSPVSREMLISDYQLLNKAIENIIDNQKEEFS